jgi:hypothetical protein
MATHLERTATLETSIGHIKGVAYVLITLLIPWAAYITINVISMKQSMVDGGNTKLVADLRAPKSPQQLQANLSTVIAQVQNARLAGKPPNPKNIEAVSIALADVVRKQPDVPEGWNAAAQIISYRSSRMFPSSKPDCETELNPPPPAMLKNQTKATEWIYLHDCTLHLDNLISWRDKNDKTLTSIAFTCNDVEIVYRGGPILPITSLQLVHCTFDFQINNEPPPPARRLTEALLAASDINKISFSSTG